MTQSTTTPRSAPLLSALDSLLAAISAYRNLRAIALMGMTFIVAAIVAALFGVLANVTNTAFVAALGGLLAMLTVLYGANAVGIMLMRDAQEQEPCGIMDAVMQSLFTTHRLIAVAFLEGLIVLAAVLVVLLALLICKIPGLGPVLFTVVFPLSAVFLGMLVFALFYVMFPLAGPAVWTGCNTFQVLARLNMLARRRLLEVVTQQIVLFIIVGFVAGVIFSMVMIGFGMATGLSAAVVGFGGGLGGMLNPYAYGAYGAYGGEGVGGHVIAGAIGSAFLFAVAAVIPALIATKGVCLVYLNITRGIDFAEAEANLQNGMDAVKAKAEQARERARQQMAEQQKNAQQAAAPAAPVAAAEPTVSATPAALACPNCHAPITAADRFCGECGHKL